MLQTRHENKSKFGIHLQYNQVRNLPQAVTLGLDPRVHTAHPLVLDARVKPEHDSFRITQNFMRESLRKKITEVCDKKIAAKGPDVGLSFYAFFANKNDDPELLMEAARWWIETHKLDHFEKAVKIKKMVGES